MILVAQLEQQISSLDLTWERAADPVQADNLKMKFWLSKGTTPLKALTGSPKRGQTPYKLQLGSAMKGTTPGMQKLVR